MVAIKLDGASIAKSIRQRLKEEVQEMRGQDETSTPSLTIIQASYVRMKLKAAQEIGIICNHILFPESISEEKLLERIHELNEDPSVHGILVQLPLPESISESAITSAVVPEKDVDGFVSVNIGELAKRQGKPHYVPCTPRGVMALLKESGIELEGKHAVVLGRSDIVGTPVSLLLKNADATVTMCHTKTKGVENIIRQADVLVVAIGRPEFVQGEWIKPGAVVIDVGINYVPDSSKKSGYRVVGDVHYPSAAEVASHITPVPGGVGPMTVAMLLENVVDARLLLTKRRQNDLSGV
ncbi:MAG: hypothetical protein M1823_002238 [Watsoniomyces obsoletus]|nr:MAG: hypothetical protein M1823_002238 [Watsoniomyces obsoletus]